MKVQWRSSSIPPPKDLLCWVHIKNLKVADGVSLGVYRPEGYWGNWCDISGDEWEQEIDFYVPVEIPDAPVEEELNGLQEKYAGDGQAVGI